MTSRSRGHVSVPRHMYDTIKREADKLGLSMSKFVEAVTADTADIAVYEVPALELESEPEPVEPPYKPCAFLCAICVRSVHGVPTREPFGRGGALVDVCVGCSEDAPRMGLNSFGG